MRMWVAAGLLVGVAVGCAPLVVEPEPQAATVEVEPVRVKPETAVSLQGDGGLSSDPFVLDPGDYRVAWTATGDCYYGFDLKPLDGQWPYVPLASPGEVAAGGDNVYDVDGGRWYVKVHTGPAPACPWTLSLSPR